MARGAAKAVANQKASAKAKAHSKGLPAPSAAGRSNSTITSSPAEQKRARLLHQAVRDVLKKWSPLLANQHLYHNIVDNLCLFDYVCQKRVELAKAGSYCPTNFWGKTAAKYWWTRRRRQSQL